KASSMTRLESRHRKTALRKSEQHHKARGQALMAHYFRLRRQDGITVNHLGLPDLKIILLDYQNNYIRCLEKWPLCQIACKMPELRLERPRKSGSNGETDPHRWYIFPPEVATMISRE
ncbi:hypothetical protein ALC56_10941, partial [Trachymyrmex septentrionalis]